VQEDECSAAQGVGSRGTRVRVWYRVGLIVVALGATSTIWVTHGVLVGLAAVLIWGFIAATEFSPGRLSSWALRHRPLGYGPPGGVFGLAGFLATRAWHWPVLVCAAGALVMTMVAVITAEFIVTIRRT
jgi:hypothetical protein